MDLSKLGITPEPWEIDFDEVDDIYLKNNKCISFYNKDTHIATVMNRKDTYLISAAPEMLEALIELIPFLEGLELTDYPCSDEMEIIFEAIEKATGLSWEQVKKKLDLE